MEEEQRSKWNRPFSRAARKPIPKSTEPPQPSRPPPQNVSNPKVPPRPCTHERADQSMKTKGLQPNLTGPKKSQCQTSVGDTPHGPSLHCRSSYRPRSPRPIAPRAAATIRIPLLPPRHPSTSCPCMTFFSPSLPAPHPHPIATGRRLRSAPSSSPLTCSCDSCSSSLVHSRCHNASLGWTDLTG